MTDFMTTEEVEQRTKYIDLLIFGYTGSKREQMLNQYENCSTKTLRTSLYNIMDDILTYGDEQTIQRLIRATN